MTIIRFKHTFFSHYVMYRLLQIIEGQTEIDRIYTEDIYALRLRINVYEYQLETM